MKSFFKYKKTSTNTCYFFMVTCTRFELVNAAVKGQCVKPLHQQAMAPQVGLEPTTP